MSGLSLALTPGNPALRPPGASASAQILSLAQSDGWTGVYDPGNASARTLRDGGSGTFYVASLSDGLGNLPAAVQATTSSQPVYSAAATGSQDCLLCNGGATPLWLRTAAFGATFAQPTTIMLVARSSDAAGGGNRYIVDGADATNRQGLLGSFGAYSYFASSQPTAGTLNTGWHVWEAVFDGASSSLLIDGTSVLTTTPGANAMGGLTLGERYTAAGSHWRGEIGPVLIRSSAADAATRARMRTLLRTLANF